MPASQTHVVSKQTSLGLTSAFNFPGLSFAAPYVEGFAMRILFQSRTSIILSLCLKPISTCICTLQYQRYNQARSYSQTLCKPLWDEEFVPFSDQLSSRMCYDRRLPSHKMSQRNTNKFQSDIHKNSSGKIGKSCPHVLSCTHVMLDNLTKPILQSAFRLDWHKEKFRARNLRLGATEFDSH